MKYFVEQLTHAWKRNKHNHHNLTNTFIEHESIDIINTRLETVENTHTTLLLVNELILYDLTTNTMKSYFVTMFLLFDVFSNVD